MVIAEQDTERPQDGKLIEQQVLKAGREYQQLMKRLKSGRRHAELERGGDIAALTRLLADDYGSTSADGAFSSKTESLKGYTTNQIRLTSADVLEQTVRAIDRGTAVETGKIRYVGTNAGKPFDITQRFTTTWVSWDGWQIIADHTSLVKQKDLHGALQPAEYSWSHIDVDSRLQRPFSRQPVGDICQSGHRTRTPGRIESEQVAALTGIRSLQSVTGVSRFAR